jgi:hypothetical protein
VESDLYLSVGDYLLTDFDYHVEEICSLLDHDHGRIHVQNPAGTSDDKVYWYRSRKILRGLCDLEIVDLLQLFHEMEIVFFDCLRQNILAYVHFPHFLFSDLLIYHAAGFDVTTK